MDSWTGKYIGAGWNMSVSLDWTAIPVRGRLPHARLARFRRCLISRDFRYLLQCLDFSFCSGVFLGGSSADGCVRSGWFRTFYIRFLSFGKRKRCLFTSIWNMENMRCFCCWYVSVPCFFLGDLQRFRRFANIYVPPELCSERFRCLARMNRSAARLGACFSGSLAFWFWLLFFP